MPQEKFIASEEQRKTVRLLSLAGYSYDTICSVTINPRTNLPISKKTLIKEFREELQGARLEHDRLVLQGYWAALQEKAPWALQRGLTTIEARVKAQQAIAEQQQQLAKPRDPLTLKFIEGSWIDHTDGRHEWVTTGVTEKKLDDKPQPLPPKEQPATQQQTHSTPNPAPTMPVRRDVARAPAAEEPEPTPPRTEMEIDNYWGDRRPKPKALGRAWRGPNTWGPGPPKKGGWMGN